jgi:histidyl-tRNA synthetase
VPKLDNGPPRGTRDLLPEQVARREELIGRLVATYAGFGFRRIETPALEDIARLTSSGEGENEKLIYKVLKRGLDPVVAAGTDVDELVDLGLRFDLTVPLTRFFAQNHGRLATPFRSMQVGPVWRAERPQKGRYRQFTQCDIDTIGEAGLIAEAELLEATLTALAAAGVGPVTAHVNDRRLLQAIAASCGLDDSRRGPFLVALDKLDKIGWDGVRSELVGRGFGEEVASEAERLISLLSSAGSADDFLARAADTVAGVPDGVLEGLRSTAEALERLTGDRGGPRGFVYELDPTIVRGLGYYTGQIFEVRHEAAAGSVAGGGRYDGLVGRWLGREVPAVGISIGFERIVDLAELETADLGVAVLYDPATPALEALSAARRIREEGRAATLLPRRGNQRAQLDALEREGFSSFVTLEGDALGQERPLRSEAPSGS